jgi:hypothetical protein
MPNLASDLRDNLCSLTTHILPEQFLLTGKTDKAISQIANNQDVRDTFLKALAEADLPTIEDTREEGSQISFHNVSKDFTVAQSIAQLAKWLPEMDRITVVYNRLASSLKKFLNSAIQQINARTDGGILNKAIEHNLSVALSKYLINPNETALDRKQKAQEWLAALNGPDADLATRALAA